MPIPRRERLEEFFRRLRLASPAATFEEAYYLIARVLTEVEDELSGQINDPSRWRNQDRFYAPQMDSIHQPGKYPHVWIFRTRGHFILVGDNGSIQMRVRRDTNPLREPALFSKVGRDGKELWEQ